MSGRKPKTSVDEPSGRGRGPAPSLEPERALAQSLGVALVAGLDEAGRGALAGPVCAAAVILPQGTNTADFTLSRINDSKKLTPRSREALFPLICDIAVAYGVGFAGAEEIDRLGIVPATHAAMMRALTSLATGTASLQSGPDALLIDGTLRLPTETPQQALVRGDSHSLSIAAASILAKVSRDQYMIELDRRFPGYGFAAHKGYGTALHLRAIAQAGPCPEHRLSFAPLNRQADAD